MVGRDVPAGVQGAGPASRRESLTSAEDIVAGKVRFSDIITLGRLLPRRAAKSVAQLPRRGAFQPIGPCIAGPGATAAKRRERSVDFA